MAFTCFLLTAWTTPGPAQTEAPPAPRESRIVAPASTDPLVVRRNANAQANAEYRAARKKSQDERRAALGDAHARYDEQISNARINRKADRTAANNALKATELDKTDTRPRSH